MWETTELTETIQKLLAEGQQRLEAGDRAGARRLLGEAVRRAPHEATLWYWLARALDEPRHALDASERAVALDPDFRAARVLRDRVRRDLEEPHAPPQADARPAASEAVPPLEPYTAPEPEDERQESTAAAWDASDEEDWSESVEGWTAGADDPDWGQDAALESEPWADLDLLDEPEPFATGAPPPDPNEEAPRAGLTQQLFLSEEEARPASPAEPQAGESDELTDQLFAAKDESADGDAEDEGPEITLDWLLSEVEQDSGAPAQQTWQENPPPESEGGEDEWAFLREISDEGPVMADEPAPVAPQEPEWDEAEAQGGAEHWSFLDELEEEVQSVAPAAPDAQYAGADVAWELLESVPEELSREQVEEELWRRAELLIGPSPHPVAPSPVAVPEEIYQGGGPAAPVYEVPPGPEQFSLMAVEPSAAASISLRNSLSPLSREQIEGMLTLQAQPNGSGEEAAPLVRAERSATARWLTRGLLILLIPLALIAAGWLALQRSEDWLPASVRANAPVATAIAEARLRSVPRPTPMPSPDWVREAHDARLANDPVAAEATLQEGLQADAESVAGWAEYALLLRDLPGRTGDATEASRAAIGAATTLEERALAVEAFAWVVAAGGSEGVAEALAGAEQAALLTPRSPHAQWARAIALARSGEATAATQAASLAAFLSSRAAAAENAARLAEVSAAAGQPEQAVSLYRQALAAVDHVPWRVALVGQLRAAGLEAETEAEISYLLENWADHPLVQVISP